MGDDDLADERGDRVAVAEHADLDLDPGDELLDEHLLVVLERELDRRAQLVCVVRLADPDGRPEPRRLDEDGVAERALGRGRAVSERDVARDGDPLVAHHGLEQVLVHAERRRCVVGADVRDVRHLEQPLQPPVLPERPVQDRQHDLDPAQRGRDLVRRARNRQLWGKSRWI